MRAKIASESTVISGSAPVEPVAREDLLVVLDDPVVDADDGAVPDRVVVGEDRGVALRVVTHVHERLRRGVGEGDGVEQRARAGSLLVHGDAGRRATRWA